MRRALSCLVLLCLFVPARATHADDEVPMPSSSVLDRVGAELDQLIKDLTRIVEQANRDPRELRIDEYEQYRGDDWKRRGRVEAEDLVKEILVDGEVILDVRKRVVAAILKQASQDPDLERDARRGRSARAKFSSSVIADDVLGARRISPESAQLGNDLLKALWPSFRDRRINQDFDPRDADRLAAAEEAWKDWLRDK